MESFYKDKNIWIIGASSGIGRALSVELSRLGATLILSARSVEKLKSLNEKLDGRHFVLPLDVTDLSEIQKAVQNILDKFKRIDSLIYLAATYDPAPLKEMDIQAAHRTVDINLNGALNIIYSLLPILRQQGYGQLALCASVAGYRGLPNSQPYSATKAALINLAESLRAEESLLDVKVINPGFVRTPMTDKNEFRMPMLIEPELAADIIAKKLCTKCFEIHFPKRFTLILKLLRIMPSFLYFKCIKFLVPNT